MLLSTQNRSGKKRAFEVNGRNYYPLLNPAQRQAQVKANDFIETVIKRRITKQYDKFLFKRLMLILRTDPEFNEMARGEMYRYIDAIRIESANIAEGEAQPPENQHLRDATNISIYNKYIETEIDPSYSTIKEALAKRHYTENECWINSLLDHYPDLMRQKRGSLSKTLTRQHMLELLHTTEEEFKNKGATTTQMENVFKEFNITARLFDFNGKLIYSFDPPDYHMHTKGFFGLIKNNHVYTINRDLKSIKKTMNAKNKPSHCDANINTSREDFKLKISSNYFISDREEPPECHMIETANDLLKYTAKPEYTLVHKDNDLVKLFHELKIAGYEPFIKYQAGTMTELKVNWKIKNKKQEITYTIKLQNLSTHSIDEDVSVENEKLFNDMNREMFNFNKKIFNDAHKSYYSQTDIDILDEAQTIVPTGYFKNNSTNETVEIDRTKAFTKAFSKITHIPVFTEFDIWKPYQNEELQGLNLYLVEASTGNIFFNKKFNLVYGMFLKRLEEKTFKIHYHKQPSHIHEVDYENIVTELWNTKISAKPKQDAKIKKTIANVNFGLLEKSTNKKQKSISFNSLEEALYYRNIYEGRVFVIEEGTLEDDEDGTLFTKYTDKYYILNVTKSRTLTNGFRYIKELLLLQNHNYDMYDTYNTLTKNNIEIFSVKSDAFVINKNHLTKAKKLVTLNNQVGGWRAENRQGNKLSD